MFGTYVFIGFEQKGFSTPFDGSEINELYMSAIKRTDLLDTEPGVQPEAQSMLQLRIKPFPATSYEGTARSSGLDNKLPANESGFDMNVFNTIDSFLNGLQPPVCLIAVGGLQLCFPILKTHFLLLGVQLSPDIKCSDSLFAFNEDKIGENELFGTGLVKSYSQLMQLKHALVLEDDFFEMDGHFDWPWNRADDAKRQAECSCIIMIEFAIRHAERFDKVISKLHCAFADVPTQQEQRLKP